MLSKCVTLTFTSHTQMQNYNNDDNCHQIRKQTGWSANCVKDAPEHITANLYRAILWKPQMRAVR